MAGKKVVVYWLSEEGQSQSPFDALGLRAYDADKAPIPAQALFEILTGRDVPEEPSTPATHLMFRQAKGVFHAQLMEFYDWGIGRGTLRELVEQFRLPDLWGPYDDLEEENGDAA